MGFIERAFTPPGTGAFVPPPVAPPAVQAAATAAPAPVAPPPAPPTLPTAPAPPAPFQPGQAPGQRQRAAGTATTMLGAAAASGQTAKKTLLGA